MKTDHLKNQTTEPTTDTEQNEKQQSIVEPSITVQQEYESIKDSHPLLYQEVSRLANQELTLRKENLKLNKIIDKLI